MSSEHEIVIEPGGGMSQYWRDLWLYRELFYFLVWRDILVRYKQTFIGIAWALIRPLLTMIVFVIIFGKLAKLPSDGIPYPLMVVAAMVPWQFFAGALSEASNSIIGSTNLISKVYFPRLIIPASSVITSFIDFLISGGILICVLAWYRFTPDWHIVALPLFILMEFAFAMGAGLLITALNVKYRDFRYIVPFLVQFGLYVSPVGFSTSIVPEKWKLLYSLNPMVGVIEGFRWAILGGNARIYWPGFILSMGLVSVLFATGLWYFRKMERSFADVI